MVIDGGLVAVEVDEELLSGPVFLAHDHVQVALPGPVVEAEPAVTPAVRLDLLVVEQ